MLQGTARRFIVCAVMMTLAVLPSTRGQQARLPVLTVTSPLRAGLYNEDGSVPIMVQVAGVDPVLHGMHEVVVRLNLQQEGWRDMMTWPLREAKAWASSPRMPLEFRSVFIDVPSGNHDLEVSLRGESSDPKLVRGIDGLQKQQPVFETSTHTPFFVRAIPDIERKPGWNSTTCKVLVDTSNVGGVHKVQHLVGFVEGPGQMPTKFEDLTARHCLLYRVVDVSAQERVQAAKYNLQQGTALMTGIGPIDGDSTSIFSRYSEEIVINILVNRLCFARREEMDLLFLVGTKSTVFGQSPMALKAKGVLAALREYSTVVWADMDGVMPLAPRPETRRCIPFTRCWPISAEVILTRMPQYPYNPSSALMIFRRSSQAFAFLAATIDSPARTSSSEEVVLADAFLSVMHERRKLVYVGQCNRPRATAACWAEVLAHNSTRRSSITSGVKTGRRDKLHLAMMQMEWPEPIGGIQLAKSWCDVESSANLSLVCPCSSSASSGTDNVVAGDDLSAFPGWCGEEARDLSDHVGASTYSSSPEEAAAAAHRQHGERRGQGAAMTGERKNVCDVKRCAQVEVLFVKFGPGLHFIARGPEVQFSSAWSCSSAGPSRPDRVHVQREIGEEGPRLMDVRHVMEAEEDAKDSTSGGKGQHEGFCVGNEMTENACSRGSGEDLARVQTKNTR